MLQQGKSVRSSPTEEEGTRGTMCDELTTVHISCTPASLWEKQVENSGVKLSPKRKEGRGKGVFKMLYFSLFTLI